MSDVTPPPPAPSESVVRPDSGLARGRYEAPSWAFALIAVAAIGTLAAIAIRAAVSWGRSKR